MRLLSWNINSLRLRLPLLKQLTERYQPDLVCLQETKVMDSLFPAEDLRDIGYPYHYFCGEKSYNGVAILSRHPLAVSCQLSRCGGRTETRHMAVKLGEVELHNVYVPAGGDIPERTLNDKFDYKLNFVQELTEWFRQERKSTHPMILVGDLNIAPLPEDVWSHKQLLTVVSHTPIEVEHLAALQATLSWHDTIRHFTPPPEKLYSWWSYRNHDWARSNRGRRLDHIWVTPALQPLVQHATILKEVRGWTQPSDHVPLLMDIALS